MEIARFLAFSLLAATTSIRIEQGDSPAPIELIGESIGSGPAAAAEPGARTVLGDLPTLVRVKRDAPIAWPLELFVGARIEVRNGCVHLANGGALAIWPPHYELLIVDGRAVGVLDPQDGSSLRFGDPADLGGGDARIANQYLDPPIPPACAGRAVQVYLGS